MTTDDHTVTTSTTADRSSTDATTWHPTRTGTVFVVLGTLAVCLLLSGTVGPTVQKGLLVSTFGAGCLAAALWLTTWERWRVPATVLASLLFIPAGVAIAGGIDYVLLVEFATSFPVPNTTRVVGQTLRIAGIAMVVVGVTAAVFGALMAVRNVVTRGTVANGFSLLVRTAVLPVGFAIVFVAVALVTNFGGALSLGFDSLVDGSEFIVHNWLFVTKPTHGSPRLVSWWTLGTVAVYTFYRAFRALPTEELAAAGTVGDVPLDRIRREFERALEAVVTVSLLGLPVVLFVGFVLPGGVLRAILPPSLFHPLVTVTTASTLRYVLVSLAVISLVTILLVRALKTSARSDAETILVGYAPYLSGIAIVATLLVTDRAILRELVGFVVGRLSPPLAGQADRLSGSIIDFFGPHAVVFGLLTAILVLACTILAALWLVFVLGFVPSRVAGVAIASGGLFVAVAFAGTIGVSLPVVLVGLVASLLVWDSGEFAATLGRELGRIPSTRRVELLHAAGTLGVGVLAALTAAALGIFVLPSVALSNVPTLAVVLPGAIVSIVLLAIAIR